MSEENKSAGKIKPFLLSFAVFPGLGQFVQGKKLLGMTIMIIVSVCLYVVLSEAFSQINEAAQRIASEGSTDYFRAQQEAHNIVSSLNTPKFLIALYSMLTVWGFSALEVFRKPTQS